MWEAGEGLFTGRWVGLLACRWLIPGWVTDHWYAGVLV